MSQKHEIINDIASELSDFRSSAQGVFLSSTDLINTFAIELKTAIDNDRLSSEENEFIRHLLPKIYPKIDKCLEKMDIYNESMTKDYTHALDMLMTLKKDL